MKWSTLYALLTALCFLMMFGALAMCVVGLVMGR